MGVTYGHHTTLFVGDRAFAHALIGVKHGEVTCYCPVLVLILLTEELDAFVDFNVLLATNVRGLELVV